MTPEEKQAVRNEAFQDAWSKIALSLKPNAPCCIEQSYQRGLGKAAEMVLEMQGT